MSFETFLKNIISISDEELIYFKKKLSTKKLVKDSFFLFYGDIANHVAFVESGLMRSYYIHESKEFTINFFDNNSFVGDYKSFLTREKTNLYIQCLEETIVVIINYSDMQEMYKNPIFERFGRLISEKLFIDITKRNESLLLDTYEERYIRLLESNPSIFKKVPQHLIASYLGMTPESLSRIKKRISLLS